MKRITDETRAAIVEALVTGELQTSIARRLNVAQGSVSAIANAEGLGGRRPHAPHFVYATVTQASGDAWRVEGTANDRTLPTMAAALSHAGAQGFRVASANGTHSEFVMERAALERASGTGEDCAHARGDAGRLGEDPGAPSNAATTATATEKESC